MTPSGLRKPLWLFVDYKWQNLTFYGVTQPGLGIQLLRDWLVLTPILNNTGLTFLDQRSCHPIQERQRDTGNIGLPPPASTRPRQTPHRAEDEDEDDEDEDVEDDEDDADADDTSMSIGWLSESGSG